MQITLGGPNRWILAALNFRSPHALSGIGPGISTTALPFRCQIDTAMRMLEQASLTSNFTQDATVRVSGMRHRIEYLPVWIVVKLFGLMPRPLARACGILLGQLVYVLHGRLRRVGFRNLQMAFPQMS